MSVLIIILAVIAVIAFWWLSRQRLFSKPWLEEGVIGDLPDTGASRQSAAKVGLGVFLAVVSSLFALLIAAYFIRMETADWRPLPIPNLVWFNTGVLIASSAALQWATIAARKGLMDDVRLGVFAGGFCALLFLTGQLLAWRLMTASGYLVAGNPANSFFYLLTGVHGLHLAGGLVALGRTGEKMWRGVDLAQLRPSLGLCTTYWHYLLIVWLVLLAMLTGYIGDVVTICRGFIS